MTGLRLWPLVRMGLRDILRHKLRSSLTMLGMVFGVGSVVAMLAVGEGASQQALDAIRKLGSQNIILTSVKPPDIGADSSKRTGQMSVYGLFYADETRIRETVPGVLRTVPARFLQKLGILGAQQMELRVVGTVPAWFEVVARPVLAGRVLNDTDARNAAAVCVLTEGGARKLLAGRNTIGQTLRLGSTFFTVIGIVRNEATGGAMQTPDRDTDAYIPMSTGIERFGEVDMRRSSGSFAIEKVELSQIIVEMASTDAVEPGMQAIEAMLRQFHKKSDYRLDVPLALLREAEATKRRFNVVLGSIAAISLLVGGIGIMNIMLASVTERTQEIGIRRAIGARRQHIVLQFLVETCVLSVGGGLVGLALGALIPIAITRMAGMPTAVRPYSLFLAFGISAGIGIVFGLYPARRAAHLDPVEALRRD
ncbi:MAG: ABC transporter permease [Kiritimatiellae bacterium]|nr:ABC transporter permease [Kiritimatiellia bacterium]